MVQNFQISIVLLIPILILVGCESTQVQKEGPGQILQWSALPGWENDDLTQTWEPLQKNCERLASRSDVWKTVCTAAEQIDATNVLALKSFYETWFVPYEMIGANGTPTGLITGYYHPLLHGSFEKSEQFKYPVYQKPSDLIYIDLRSIYPDLPNRPLRGRLEGNTVIPYFSREEIEAADSPLKGQEIVWVDDPVQLFFVHIQGSGRVELPDGKTVGIGYSDQNGHPYVAIGKVLADTGMLPLESISMQSIRTWLFENPKKANILLNENPSYIFFENRGETNDGPLGSLSVPLSAGRSIAVDRSHIPLGTPVWLSTTLPLQDGEQNPRSFQRLVFAQDTGGAIKGANRADVYWGEGKQAEFLAGHMKQEGTLVVLLPKQIPLRTASMHDKSKKECDGGVSQC